MKVTEAQIKRWKAKYGEVYEIEVEMDEEGKDIAVGYFRKPDLNVIAAVARFAESDPVKSGIVLFENTWLGGDERIKEDDEAKLGVIQQLQGVFKAKTARLKKL